MKRLVAEDDEGQFLEFKPAEERPSSLATSLAAFANAAGGTLLVGITEQIVDDRAVHVITGVPDVKIATDHLYTAAEMCTPKYDLAAPERIDVDGRTVLAVTVPEGLSQVYGVEGHYVAREGSHRRALTPEEIRVLLSRRGLFTFDRMAVPGATRAHLDERLVRAYVARFRSGGAMGADALLEARELLVRPVGDPDGPLVPSVAGLLLLGHDPQRFFPQARVAVVQYAGVTMGESFLKQEIEGPVPQQLSEAEAWLVRNTLHGVQLRGMERIDHAEYPRVYLAYPISSALRRELTFGPSCGGSCRSGARDIGRGTGAPGGLAEASRGSRSKPRPQPLHLCIGSEDVLLKGPRGTDSRPRHHWIRKNH